MLVIGYLFFVYWYSTDVYPIMN